MKKLILSLALAIGASLPAEAQPTGAAYSNPIVSGVNGPDWSTHPRAMPSCRGFGCSASIGTDYDVYWVNTGADTVNQTDQDITFRECVEAQPINTGTIVLAGNRPRYCLFKWGGHIKLRSPLKVTVPKLHIVGQSAPNADTTETSLEVQFDSFSLWSNPLTNPITPGPATSLLEINTDDVIVEYMRFRGNVHTTPTAVRSDAVSAIVITGGKRIVIKNNSLMYTTDQVMTVFGGENISIIHNIIGPMLCGDPGPSTVGHSEPNHCRPMIVTPGRNVTIAFNAIGWGEQRGANVAGGMRNTSGTPLLNQHGQIDVISNFIYFFRQETGLVTNTYGHTYENLINNAMWEGPRFDTGPGGTKNYPIAVYNKPVGTYGGGSSKGFKIYHTGNSFFRNTPAVLYQADPPNTQQVCGITANSNPPTVDCNINGLAVVSTTTPAVAPENVGLNGDGISILAADRIRWQHAIRQIFVYAGASICRDDFNDTSTPIWCRDIVDRKAVHNLGSAGDLYKCSTAGYNHAFSTNWSISRTNAFGDAPANTGSFTTTDTDNDGIPNSVETTTFPGVGSTTVFDSNGDADGDGYTNLQEVISWMAGQQSLYDDHRVENTSITIPAANCGRTLRP
jgi:pectate lyase